MEDIIKEALLRYPIGGKYTINQKIPYEGLGSTHSFIPTKISDYVWNNGNLSICGVGVYHKDHNIWDREPINVEPNYEIY